jgi:hypothetical protein
MMNVDSGTKQDTDAFVQRLIRRSVKDRQCLSPVVSMAIVQMLRNVAMPCACIALPRGDRECLTANGQTALKALGDVRSQLDSAYRGFGNVHRLISLRCGANLSITRVYSEPLAYASGS